MNSFNHIALGSVGEWMYAVVAEIDLDPERPGYKRVVLRPRPGGGLTHASGELRSLHGPILSDWTIEDGVITGSWRCLRTRPPSPTCPPPTRRG